MSALQPDLVTNLSVCPAPEVLRQHISGWLSESESEEIERHLSRCSACEAAALQFEPGHDTLMQSLQATVGQQGQNDVTTAVDGGSAAEQLLVDSEESPISVAPESIKSSPIEAPMEAAIDRARRLLDAPLQTESERSHRDWNPPQRELGVYELLKPLGRGGMGAVYLARHRQLGKQVAIKLLPVMSAEDSDVRTRFDREIRVVGRLNHPSIVAATDAGEIEGTQFLVMEYVPGLDLSRLARLMGRLPIADACELIRQASLGLSCAHAEGVVHRDIKPSNLMLDDQGRIRILDFGLAQWTVWDEASVDLTTVGQLMGTLDYMAPEQAEAVGSVDYRADLYALGATLFRLLCGRAPLAAAPNQSPLEKLRLLANHQPPKLSTLCPEAPEELVKLVASLLSRRPSDRPASAAHVAEQLAPFAEGSKLVDLLQQAKEKAATSPELLKKSAFPDPPPFLSPAPASLAPLLASSGGGRSKILRRLLLAASLPILIIAGILIKLETSKGQLVIESDVDNVSVKLLKDGKPVDGIKVSHGTTSTRLNADNYEITIDGPSDGLVIDNDRFTLKNGETVVARITTATLNAAEPNVEFGGQVAEGLSHSKLSANNAHPSQSVFHGKNLPEWLNLLRVERSSEMVMEGLSAVSTLAKDADRESALPIVVEILKTTDDDTGITASCFRTLFNLLPNDLYVEWWAREYEGGSSEWRRKLATKFAIAWSPPSDQTTRFTAFLKWYELRVALRDSASLGLSFTPEEKESLAGMMVSLGDACIGFRANEGLVSADRIMRLLQPLSDQWWLEQTFDLENRSNAWKQDLVGHVIDTAAEIIANPQSDSAAVTEAALIVKFIAMKLSPGTGDGRFVASRLSSQTFQDAVDSRLLKIANENSNLSEMHFMDQRLKWFCGVKQPKPCPIDFASWHVDVDSTDAKGNELIALLELCPGSGLLPNARIELAEGSPTSRGLHAVWKLSKAIEADVSAMFLDQPESSEKWLHLTVRWPSLDVQAYDAIDKRTPLDSASFWKDQTQSKDRWFLALLHDHPVLLGIDEKLKAKETPHFSAREKSPEQHPATASSVATDAPLYEGKPLEHWLDMLSRERSVLGLKQAIEGCTALVAEDNAGAVTDALLKALPGLDGELKVTDKETNSVWTLDYVADGLLRKANPGSRYFAVWVKARSESTDRKWHERLLKLTDQRAPESPDELAPLIEWGRIVLSKSEASSSQDPSQEKQAAIDAAVLLRNFSGINYFGTKQPFVDFVAPILTESPMLDDRWWISEPLLYRGPNGSTELWPAPIKAKIRETAVRVLEKVDSDPSLVVQACIILANGAALNDEQKTAVLTSVQRRLEDASKSPETLAEMVTLIRAFSDMAVPNVGNSTGLGFVALRIQVSNSFAASVRDTDASLVLQLLNVVTAIDSDKRCQPQVRKIFESSRDVFEILNAQRLAEIEGRANTMAAQFGQRRRSSLPPLDLYWPSLTANVDASTPIRPGSPDSLEAMAFKTLWGEHVPSKQDWLKYLILLHPAMQDVVTAEIEKAGGPEAEK